jgi:hypothetical protein
MRFDSRLRTCWISGSASARRAIVRNLRDGDMTEKVCH